MYSLQQIAEITQSQWVFDSAAGNIWDTQIIDNFYYDTRILPEIKDEISQNTYNPPPPPTPKGIYLCLQGNYQHGRQYIIQAYKKGIRIFWVDSPPTSIELQQFPDCFWLVSISVIKGLQSLAAFHRRQYNIPIIAITGSNGKTILKEWLYTILCNEYDSQAIYKSPLSFNSQLGVALSLLGLRSWHEIAIIEAGISHVNEMQSLAAMIAPTLGILTHLGDAHSAGFASFEQKVNEKLKLFTTCQLVLYHPANRAAHFIPQLLADISIQAVAPLSAEQYPNALAANLANDASQNNIQLAAAMAEYLGMKPPKINEALSLLSSVAMRMEIIADNPEITIWNDAYTADITSVRNAIQEFTRLRQTNPNKKMRVILTDLEQQGQKQHELQQRILAEIQHYFTPPEIILIGNTYYQIVQNSGLTIQTYISVADFIAHFDYHFYKDGFVLLKGARRYQLEQLIPYFSLRPNAAYLKINLNALKRNFDYLRQQIPKGTHVVAMVKAAAYGSGAWQIARALEPLPIDYFGVAYTGEGVELRQKGIQKPIFALTPDSNTLSQLFAFDIEPVISSFRLLHRYLDEKKQHAPATMSPIHLEFDTGMARLGFMPHEITEVLQILAQQSYIKIVSVLSHLSSADEDAANDFTTRQFELFASVVQKIVAVYPQCLFHISNTAGVLRWGKKGAELLHISNQQSMVRLGIGLYGIHPFAPLNTAYNTNAPAFAGYPETENGLEEIATLIAPVQQIHEYPAHHPIGYGGAHITQRPTRVATLPIGYADGLPRRVGMGKFSVWLEGALRPIIGRVCMDMTMVDVTDPPFVNEDAEALIFGYQNEYLHSVLALANAADTIPYEILAGINPRVRRLYVNE